jgi:hypothetical protein
MDVGGNSFKLFNDPATWWVFFYVFTPSLIAVLIIGTVWLPPVGFVSLASRFFVLLWGSFSHSDWISEISKGELRYFLLGCICLCELLQINLLHPYPLEANTFSL